jgi:dynactin complex subunit
MSSTIPPPPVGTRIAYRDEYNGTIRFCGPVDGTTGEWLGMEWDDVAERGKNDGTKDGRRYFRCV